VDQRLNLNLLPIAVALYEERGVSKTATRLGMSQPAVSAALAKLRKAFDDPLFIRTARGMEPTPRAQAMIAPARDVLLRVERDVLSGLTFDPATANVTFTIALSDVGEMVFLPKVLERLQSLAPLASLHSVSPPPRELREGLETGEIDLAIGYFPDLESNNFFQQRLFNHHFCCLLRADHPITGARLSLTQFLRLRHIAVHAAGRSQELFERFLVRKKVHPKVLLVTPHFLSLPTIIGKSDLVATVPHAVGIFFSGAGANIKALSPPFTDAPSIVLKQHWHRKANHDARNRWLRSLVSELFTQESDEWKSKRAS
jgi:DNA-binding transcriptional LysR family regulator